LGRKLDSDVKCIWKVTDKIPEWSHIFNGEGISNGNFKRLDFFSNAQILDENIIERPNCNITFEAEVGLYLHRFQEDFKGAVDGKFIHLDNPVGIYLLEEEDLIDVIKELSEIFHSIPFNDNIKSGFRKIDRVFKEMEIKRDESVSIHIRRGDAVDYAKTDTIALFERIVPVHEYISRIENLEKMMVLKHVIVGSDDPKMVEKIAIGGKEISIHSIFNFIRKDDFSEIEFDIIDLYLLSKTSGVSSGFSAYSILAGIIGRVPVHRLDLNQDLERRLEEIEKEVFSGREVTEHSKKTVLSAYSYVHRRMMKDSDFVRARRVASEMEEIFKDESEPKNLLGNLAFLEGDYEGAAILHRSSIEIDPMNSHFHVALAHALQKTDRLEGQIVAEKAFLLNPLNQNSIRLLTDIYRTNGELRRCLICLIYLEMLQNFSGANIESITEIAREIASKKDAPPGFEGQLVQLIEGGKANGKNLVSSVKSEILSEGSHVSHEIMRIIGSKIPPIGVRDEIISKLNENKNSEDSLVFSTERFIDGRRALIGGLADRMKGASTVMLLSIALGRRFEIEWEHPEELGKIFNYSGYEWTFREDQDVNLEVDLIDRNFTSEIREKLRDGNLEDVLPSGEQRIKIFCNSVDVGIGKNEYFASEFSDSFKTLNRTKTVGSLLSMLEYRPGLEESMILMVFLSRMDSYDRTIAVHFRTGGDGGWRDPEMDEVENVEKLIQRAREISLVNEGRVGIYFACDSENLKKRVLEKYSSDLEIFSSNIPLAHIDRSDDKGAVMGSRFAMMENFMISMCDEILTGKGAFAELSANRVFVEPWRYF
jgi:hypothetical protein